MRNKIIRNIKKNYQRAQSNRGRIYILPWPSPAAFKGANMNQSVLFIISLVLDDFILRTGHRDRTTRRKTTCFQRPQDRGYKEFVIIDEGELEEDICIL